MKTLNRFIKEQLDDNLFWKLDIWFSNSPEQYQEFLNLISSSMDNNTVSQELLSQNILTISLYPQLKEFINFMIDDKDNKNEKDYIYQLKKIIELLLANKSKNILKNKG